ncbi:arylamine N-acetyltransferase family protein [Polyangium spumosum]|uniref:Uncharacterized protein n=1 Tax=Polyangium spumosum TaxID=889282 RepID=A0A6N7PT88_9BACT|nr:hypothetical protein [Polyangium spumosum]
MADAVQRRGRHGVRPRLPRPPDGENPSRRRSVEVEGHRVLLRSSSWIETLANSALSTHPRSHFRAGLIAARSAPGLRCTLRNRQFAVHHRGGPTERRVLTSSQELRQTLERDFLLAVPDAPELDAAFDRLT